MIHYQISRNITPILLSRPKWQTYNVIPTWCSMFLKYVICTKYNLTLFNLISDRLKSEKPAPTPDRNIVLQSGSQHPDPTRDQQLKQLDKALHVSPKNAFASGIYSINIFNWRVFFNFLHLFQFCAPTRPNKGSGIIICPMPSNIIQINRLCEKPHQ